MSKKVILATGVDLNYYQTPVFQTYTSSIIQHSNFDANIIVLLDAAVENPIDRNLQFTTVHSKDIQKLNINKCLQHGEFLKADAFSGLVDEDIIIFTDGDMTLQRGLSDEERTFIETLSHGDVYVGYNASPDDTLVEEASRLGLTGYQSTQLRSNLEGVKVYNTGVLCMAKSTWISLVEEYVKLFSEVDRMFHHYAKQQWLISYIIGVGSYKVHEMSYVVHNHTHYPSPDGTAIDANGIVTFNGEVVLFKHKWF